MELQAFGMTDPGKRRKRNEDRYHIDNELGLYIVCDGVGGHAAGNVASEKAAELVSQIILQQKPEIDAMSDSAEMALSLTRLVQEAVQTACRKIRILSQENNLYQGMATTLTMLLVSGDKGVMGHVGDSRLYMKREGKIHQLSNDHTIVNELLQQGVLSAEQAKSSPYAHVLTRSVGFDEGVQVDTLIFDVLPNDLFLLCSDGFSNSLPNNEQLESWLQADRLANLPLDLVKAANERDGSDNITVVVVSAFERAIDAAQELRTQEVMLKIDMLRQMYIFQDLDLRELLLVVDLCAVLECPQGQVLIQEGEHTDRLYIILDGEVMVERANSQIAVLGKGNHFGEMAVLNDGPRTASVRCSSPSRVLYVERDSFLSLIRQESQIGVKILWQIGNELSMRLESANLMLFGKGDVPA